MYRDRKHISGCLGPRPGMGIECQEASGIGGGSDGKVPSFNCGDSYKRLYICQKMDIFFIEGKLNLTKDDFKK